MRPVCVNCRRSMERIESGVVVIEMAIALAGPYKIWHADLFECPSCEAKVVHDFGDRPTSWHGYEHFERDLLAVRSQDKVTVVEVPERQPSLFSPKTLRQEHEELVTGLGDLLAEWDKTVIDMRGASPGNIAAWQDSMYYADQIEGCAAKLRGLMGTVLLDPFPVK